MSQLGIDLWPELPEGWNNATWCIGITRSTANGDRITIVERPLGCDFIVHPNGKPTEYDSEADVESALAWADSYAEKNGGWP